MAKFAQRIKTGRVTTSDEITDPFGPVTDINQYTFAKIEELEKVLKDAINSGLISSSQQEALEFIEVEFEQTIGE